MKVIRSLLYATSVLFMLSIIGVLGPWDWINAVIRPFSPEVYPDQPLVQYSIKAFLLIMFWIGVLLAIAVRRPRQNRAALFIIGWMCLSAGIICIPLGVIYQVPKFFYYDALSGMVIGILVFYYRARQA